MVRYCMISWQLRSRNDQKTLKIQNYQHFKMSSASIYKANQINTSVPIDRHRWLITFVVSEPSRNVGVLTPAAIDQCAFCHNSEDARPSRQASYPPQELGTSQSRAINKSKKNRFENIWDLRTVLAQIGTSGSSGREGHGAARTPLWHGCRPRPGWDPNQCPQHLWFRNDWHRASTGALQATTKKMNIVSQEQIKYRPWTYELTIIAYNCSNSDYFMKWLTGLQV